MQHSRSKAVFGLVLSVLVLAGCDISTPSQVNVTPIRLKDDVRTETIDANRIDRDRIAIIADSYAATAQGPMSLTVAHVPRDLWKAKQQALLISSQLVKRGVKGVSVNYVPVDDAALAGRAVLTWKALSAAAPDGCTRMVGYKGVETMKEVRKYRMGCEVQANIARMVADPSDLLGKSGSPDEDSRRHGIVTEPYNAGKKNEPMSDSLNASEISGQGGGG